MKGKEGPRNMTERGRKEEKIGHSFSFSTFFLCFYSATCCFSKIYRTKVWQQQESLVCSMDLNSFVQIMTVTLEYVVQTAIDLESW